MTDGLRLIGQVSSSIPGLRVSGRSMGLVTPPLTPKVHVARLLPPPSPERPPDGWCSSRCRQRFFTDAPASCSEPSTLKCSSDSNRCSRACSTVASRNSRATSEFNRRCLSLESNECVETEAHDVQVQEPLEQQVVLQIAHGTVARCAPSKAPSAGGEAFIRCSGGMDARPNLMFASGNTVRGPRATSLPARWNV